MSSKNILTNLLILTVLITILLIPSGTLAQTGPIEDHAGGVDQRIRVVLTTNHAPGPGGTAHLDFTATPLVATPDLVIEWFIPQGVTMQGKNPEVLRGQTAGHDVQKSADLTFSSPGTYKIAVSATFHPFSSASFSASGVLFFVIAPNGSYVSDKDPSARRPVNSGLSEQVTVSSLKAPNTPEEANGGDPCFTVTGHIERFDIPVTPNGYDPHIVVPVVNAPVEIREEDLVFDDDYGTTLTNSNGDFSKSFCDDDGWFDDELEIYFRLPAERYVGGGGDVYVEDSSWIDEKYEYDSSVVSSEGGTIEYNLSLDMIWSGMFNIIDAASLANLFWRESGDGYSDDTEIHWEPGYGDNISYYDSFWDEITISDDPSDPDQWDDSVIMHEWGHSADDYYSCDDSPGGSHSFSQLTGDSELSWGEGYPDYYQSAVRSANGYDFAQWYLDFDGSEVHGIAEDFEHFDVNATPNLISTFSEVAIAAALWDLNDNANDGQDTVAHGHAMIQDVYTSNSFEDVAYGLFDDKCNFDTYMRGWVEAGKPQDAATAAAVLQNTGYTLLASLVARPSQTDQGTTILTTNSYTPAEVYRWWKQLTFVADNSNSMEGPKYEAMKAIFAEAVNDLSNDPAGTEFSLEQFNNLSFNNSIEFAGQFFPENLIEPINALNPISNSDPYCKVYALQALTRAIDNKEKGDVWLFTDGDARPSPLNELRQVLNEKQLRASIALMDICPLQSEPAQFDAPINIEVLLAMSAEEQETFMAELFLRGQARVALGSMAEEIPGGLVPYILTALNSGGQFLYVDESHVNNAADILRAQITNSAGAGRWSDYVSDEATYRFDWLASYEYNWIDATDGTDQGIPEWDGYLTIPLPVSFPYYDTLYTSLKVFYDGYISFGNHTTATPSNTTLPFSPEPNNSLYAFWDELGITCFVPSPDDVNTSDRGLCTTRIYTKEQGDWFIIEYYYFPSYIYGQGWEDNIFEILLNFTTGEIRYQYLEAPGGASTATIGLENDNGSRGIQVSYNDIDGASDEMGYKFTPAPPQPTKTYSVTVDSTMEAIGFLLTGYSGTFEPLLVQKPNGMPVICGDSGVYCLDLDLVQYVQVNTNGMNGIWHVTVDAGSSGEGTFSFTSFAASPLAVESRADHTVPTISQPFLINLTQPVDENILTGFFLTNSGNPFGSNFMFYDDGAHDDGEEGDGQFGSDPFTPPSAGNAFLWLIGEIEGEAFMRIDPTPYTFTPLKVTSLGDRDNFGFFTTLSFEISNLDTVDHCYYISYIAPSGWIVALAVYQEVCLSAGQSTIEDFSVTLGSGPNDLPSGTSGDVIITLFEVEKGEISDADSATITRRREPAFVEVERSTNYIRPNGDTTDLAIYVLDDQFYPVADGTNVSISAVNGSVTPVEGTTINGYLFATFTSGPNVGVGQVTATTTNNVSGSVNIEIGIPKPSQITLLLSDTQVAADGVSQVTLTALVTDRWGDPVAGQEVHIGVEGDGQLGSIEGGEVAIGVTDANGEFVTTFTGGEIIAKVWVRAELYYEQEYGPEVVHYDRREISVGTILYIPFLVR